MLKHLISLVILLIGLSYLSAYSDTAATILPKLKPNDLSKSVKEKNSFVLPSKKPSIKLKKNNVKKFIVPKEKPLIRGSTKLFAERKLKKKPTNVVKQEQLVKKKIEENKISRSMFDTALKQILGRLDASFDDFQKSNSFRKSKVDVYRFDDDDNA